MKHVARLCANMIWFVQTSTYDTTAQWHYDLSYWQSAFCNTIWYVQTANCDTGAHWSNWHVFCALPYDLSYWQSVFCNTIWFFQTTNCDTAAHWSNWHVIYELRYDLSNWQSVFCKTIWYVQRATFDTSAHRNNRYVLMHSDRICLDADNSFLLLYGLSCSWKQFFVFHLRYDLSRQLPNLFVNWVNL